MANYRVHNRDQIEIKHMCVNDYVSKDHKARTIWHIVSKMDLSSFDEYFTNDHYGNKAYPLKDLLSILIYSFSEGVYHTRKIEKSCRENISYRFLCCDDAPDHSTISRFFSRFKKGIEEIFVQTVYIAETQDLVNFEHLSGDGVKIKSMGSRAKLFNDKSAKKRLENIEKKISKIMEEIDNNDDTEDKNLLAKKIDEQNDIKNRIEEGLKELEKIQNERKKEKKKADKEISNYYHITEDEAKLLKKRDNYISGYNAQALVDSKTNIILSTDVTNTVCDKYNGKPLLEKAKAIIGDANMSIGHKTFDNGYLGNDLLKYWECEGLDLYIPTPIETKMSETKLQLRKDRTPELNYDIDRDLYICKLGEQIIYKRKKWIGGRAYGVYERLCKNCKLAVECTKSKRHKRKRKLRRLLSEDRNKIIEQNRNKLYVLMKEKMSSEDAKKIYRKRLPNIEPVFAHIEEHRGFRRFSVWGMDKGKSQWSFVCAVHNIYKIIRNLTSQVISGLKGIIYSSNMCYAK